MTEQPPIAPGATTAPVEPRSLPETLVETTQPLPPPNQIEERARGRTDLIVWSLIGLVLIGGLVTMALTWRDIAAPDLTMPAFEAPQLVWPWDRRDGDSPEPAAPGGANIAPDGVPEGMTTARGDDARPVGRSDKPPTE